MKTLLYIEDEITVLKNVSKTLTANNYHVFTAENLEQAREHLYNQQKIDAIILDIMLPDGNGLDLLRELRESGSKIPIIMLTAWGEPQDVKRGLKLGANDYMSKPFDYGVLLERVNTMFRNVEQIPDIIVKGSVTLRIRSMEVWFGNNQKIKLPPVEFFLLQLFIENENKDIKAEYLYEQVWGSDMADDTQAVQKAVSRLRKKIAGSGYTIAAVYGGSYRFERG
ncbi:MAG: response regulator transcription factor [Oscillospiraceae bacterium]|nr:response regulator transcription factor [Oscillospiraceae bacterium]